MFKKWKPFWSYDIENTEKWLSEMARKGHRLSRLNKKTRMFSFENGEKEDVEYHISYDKNQQILPSMLANAGWTSQVTDGNWQILENHERQIRIFPSRDELVKRNRLHSLILTIISIYYGLQLILPMSILLIMLTSSSGTIEVESSPFWFLTILYFLQVIAVMILAVTMTRKLRTFERNYYDMDIDKKISVGKTFAKWKPNWMMAPDLTKKWLEEMALKGSHLIKIQGTRFVFEKDRPKQTTFALDFQWRTSPAYTEIHKSAGWTFMHTTAHSFFKTTIWAKEYEAGEAKPQLIYDVAERKAQKRKVVIAQGSLMIFMLLLMGFILWGLVNSFQDLNWTFYARFLVVALTGTIVMYLYYLARMTRFAFKSHD